MQAKHQVYGISDIRQANPGVGLYSMGLIPSGQYEVTCVQQRAARIVTNNYRDQNPDCMTSMMKTLNWNTLQQRRQTSRLVMMFKIYYGLVDIDSTLYLTPGDSRTRGALKFQQSTATTDVNNNSYFPHTIRDWNGLSSSFRTATTIDAFRLLLGTTVVACPGQQ
ncbi:hypothetical protein FSP39_003822 [Pinctada imbricata]|uniref:Uncharacterized protein n=1 Tax=Pinctada imbricata TaxID=66713 RepID=A0AA88XKU0_PINIB|nr:hypothetical protein FSP39_003822 [Pinctada imbricata]